jgi:precorrin-4 methylase
VRAGIIAKIREAVGKGQVVAALESGDPMLYGTTYYLEALEDLPTEVIPGISSFQAGCAALKKSPTFGWDTSAVILTMDDWEGRADLNEALMKSGSSFVFFAIAPDYPQLVEAFSRHYAPNTPMAVVCYAGDPIRERIYQSTVRDFLREVPVHELPIGMHLLFVGKFIKGSQARKDALEGAVRYLRRLRDQ